MTDPLVSALRVSYATVTWSTASGVAATAVAVRTNSLSLGGLGASVLVDVGSSLVLVWRFRAERAHQAPHLVAERRAHLVAACGLLALGVSLVVVGSQRLVTHRVAHPGALAMTLAAASAAVLPVLARWKYLLAAALPSQALRTDAHITVVGAATSVVTLLGLALTRAFHWTWADAAAAALIGLVAAHTGRGALRE